MKCNTKNKLKEKKPLEVNAWVWSFRDPSFKRFPENINLWYNYWDIK